MYPNETFGQMIRRMREEKGQSSRQMALELELSFGYLSKIERDIEKPSIELIRKLANHLDGNRYHSMDEWIIKGGHLPEDIEEMILKEPSLCSLIRRGYTQAVGIEASRGGQGKVWPSPRA